MRKFKMTESSKKLRFRYVNWKNDEHEYLVTPEDIVFGDYPPGEHEFHWFMNALVHEKDGSRRSKPLRRSFLLSKLIGCTEE